LSLRALIWDVDGTLAETERDGHRVAFNRAFAEHGLPWRWDEAHYGELLAVAGGRERLLHDMAARPEAPAAGPRIRLAQFGAWLETARATGTAVSEDNSGFAV
jgi:phosphoglycolate phosphatase-like HAD superfamily hydrolase